MYQPDQIRAAFERTVEFFRANPDKHLKLVMSDTDSCFDPNAACFCFAGRLARELGPLPNAPTIDEGYAPGYNELDAIEPGLSTDVYIRNDKSETLDEVIEKERELFAEKGLI